MPELPSRLHHSAAVVRDLGASKVFYEQIMGLPLVATWCESNERLGDFCHAFFRNRASAELERWLAGDHKTNNNLREAANTQ